MVGNNSSDYHVRDQMDACETHLIITDSERGEMVCGGCGLILVQNMPDTSYQNISHGQDAIKTARTGPATSLTMYDKGLSTVIGVNKDSSGNML